MKKKLFLALIIATLFVCIFAISASAITQAEADKYYYDKVYVTADGQHELALYEKSGDTYYPLVWFAYDVLGEDGTTVVETKYVKARYEDISVYSEAPSQGRFNGVYYEYTDENGNQIVLNSSNAVLINMRGVATRTIGSGGQGNGTNITILKFEWSKSGYPSFSSKLEAVYTPLSMVEITGYTPNSVRILDYDRHHGSVTVQRGAFQNSKAKVVFIPGGSTFSGNDQFKDSQLETIIFGAGTKNITISGYTFSGANSLKRIYWLGTKAELDTITVNETSNNGYWNLTHISFENYLLLSDEEKQAGKYLVYETPECFALGHLTESINDCVDKCTICDEIVVNHSEDAELTTTIVYESFGKDGEKVTACQNDGCTYNVTEKLDALVECLGYSAPIDGSDGFTIKYRVNSDAIVNYTTETGKEVSYGLFVVTKASLGDNDVFAEDGTLANGVLTADVTNTDYVILSLKMLGFTKEESKTLDFAIGAYVITEKEEVKEFAYIQAGDVSEGEKYNFTTYEKIISALPNE